MVLKMKERYKNDSLIITANSYEQKLKKNEQHNAGLELLGMTLKKYFEIENFKIEYMPSGKPYLSSHKNIFINISNSSYAVACAVSKSEIGIDIERFRKYPEKILTRVLSDNELEYFSNYSGDKNKLFFKFWTLKESYIKMIGDGLKFGLKNAEFEIPGFKSVFKNVASESFIFENDFIISYCQKKDSR